ncbi:gamma-aminobutyric acid type B receptor subunit 2-like [Liolophura sinensis]|uniref:gamma-aminobutyric acid type B receptor subunit 2-like n=1 Tax=Liolophura sinensis TaxID=3198878 RepID=UPI0031588777
MVNDNSTLLKDYELKMYFNDSKCDMAVATKLLFDTLHDRKDNAMLFGDACFEVTGPMAQISKWWNMSQLSYADTNPVLSDRTKYTKLFRVVPSDSDFNPARLALLRHFMWRRVGTIFQDASKGSPRYGYAHNRLVSLLENSTIQVHNPESYNAETANDVQNPKGHHHLLHRSENFTFQVPITDSFADDPASAVQNLLDRDVRIILGNFSPNMSRRVFCEAYKRNMYGAKYQWIILGDSSSADWGQRVDQSVSCTEDQIKTAMHGFIATDMLPLSSGDEETESELTPQEYLTLYNKKRGKDFSRFHGYAFDGVWVIAKALDKLLKNAQIDDSDEDWEMVFRTPEMEEALDETNFQGVTGTVKFQNGDRIGMIEIQQFQDGKLVKVGEFQKDGDHLTLEGYHPLIWAGNGPPRDGYLQKSEMQRVNTPIYAALCVLSGIGIVMALVFLTTNIYFRKHRYIKMSSPNMNNIIIVGCIMNYISVFLLGTDGGLLPSSRFPLMCSARAWVLAVGFTLAFGAMFSKTWRVHAIFTNIKLNKKVIKDYKLFFIVCVLLLLDAVILALWQGIDPLQRSVKSLAPEIVGDVEIIPLIEFCHSKHMTAWMATLYVYKGLLLVFGCFLAWETRQVSIPALNDSKYIGMSVYNVVIMCVCGAAVSFVIKDQPNAAFIIIGLFIIFCTTITLCLVFVPKVVELQRDPEGEDKRVRATLKKPSKRDKNGVSDLHDRVKILSDENIRYKDILEEKNREIRELLRELGEDVNSFDYSIKSPMHKSVLTLRQKTNPDMSPSKVSRSSAGTEDDNASFCSDSSLTQLYIDSPEHHRHSSYLHSRNSNSVTESIELTDIGRKSTTGKLSPIRDSREYIEVDSYDPYSGVYLGPSEPEVTVVENVNYRPPATEEHPIIQRYSGVSFLDECQTGHPGHLSEDSDQEESEPDNNNSVHSGGSLPVDFVSGSENVDQDHKASVIE